MERSTRGVVEGTQLSDAAGKALEDIDRVSRELDELIVESPARRARKLSRPTRWRPTSSTSSR